MTANKRFAACIALLLAAALLFSVGYLVLEADHHCSGTDCAVCAQIENCENLLRQGMPALALLLAAICLRALCGFVIIVGLSPIHRPTLTELKVKLTD